MTKLKEIVLKNFTKLNLEPNLKSSRYQCNYCPQKYSYQATRMKDHLSVCGGCPQDVKLLLSSKNSYDYNEESEVDEAQNRDTTLTKRIPQFCDQMSEQDQQKASELLAKAIYCSGSPLNLVSNDYWLDFFHFIRPAFKTPKRDTISNKLLDLIYEKVKAEVDFKISNATNLSMECDAWSNIRNEGKIIIIIILILFLFFLNFLIIF